MEDAADLDANPDRLVHPKPISVDKLSDDAPWDEPLLADFNTISAARAVLAVAQARCALADASPQVDLIAIHVELAVASRAAQVNRLAEARIALAEEARASFYVDVENLNDAVIADSVA